MYFLKASYDLTENIKQWTPTIISMFIRPTKNEPTDWDKYWNIDTNKTCTSNDIPENKQNDRLNLLTYRISSYCRISTLPGLRRTVVDSGRLVEQRKRKVGGPAWPGEQTAIISTYRIFLDARDVIAGNAHKVVEARWDCVCRPGTDNGVSKQIHPDVACRRVTLGAACNDCTSLTDFQWIDCHVDRWV